MKRKRRLIIVLLAVLPAFVLLAASAIYVAFQVRGLLRHVDVLLVEELRRQTGRAVKVGKVEASPLGVLTIHNLRIANGKSFEAGTLLDAKRVIVRYRWLGLATGRIPPIQSVESVRLISPKILLERYATGRLNIQDLLAPRPKKLPPFIGVVDGTGGTAVFRDWLAHVPGPKPVVTRIVGLEGTFDATQAPFYVYNLTGRGPGQKLFDRVGISGSIDSRAGKLSVDIRATDAAAGHWWGYFIRPGAVRVLGGRAGFGMSATRRIVGGRRIWRYVGSADLSDGRSDIVDFSRPATGLHGKVRFTESLVDLSLSGALASTRFEVTGGVVGFVNPVLNLRVVSRNAHFAEVLSALPVPSEMKQVNLVGRGPITVSIVGPASDLAYTFRAAIPEAEWYGYRAADLDVRATYADNVVEIESAAARALDGRVAIRGSLALVRGGATLGLGGSASNVQLAAIPELRGAGLSARAMARFSITGTYDSPRLGADVQVTTGIFSKLAFKDALAQVAVTKDQVKVQSLSVGTASGVVRVAGTVSGSGLDLDAAATGVDVQRALKPFGLTGYSGIASFRGRITGPPSNPTATGSAEIFNGRVVKYEFDYARADVAATRSEVAFSNAAVRVLPAEVAGRGRIAGIGTRAPTIELDLDVTDAPAERVLSLLQVRADVVGTVSGQLAVRGAVPNVTVQGSVKLSDGTVAGYPVTEAQANVAYGGGQLRLTDFSARSNGAVLNAEGTVDDHGKVDFTFAAKNVALARLSDLTARYAALSGAADIAGRVSGTTRQPNVSASVSSAGLTINTGKFDRFAGDVTWDGTTFAASNVSLGGSHGELSAKRAAYDRKEKTVAVEGGALRDFPFPLLYTLVADSPYLARTEAQQLRSILSRLRRPDSGALTGSFSGSGPLDQLEASANLSAREINIGQVKNVQMELAAASRRGLVSLDSFRATAGAMSVEGRGTLSAGGNTDLEIDAYNVDLAALVPAAGPIDVTGTATVRASVQGPIRSPNVTASVEMVDPIIYGIAFERLRASQITISQNAVEISRVILEREVHSATLYGTLPWDWSTLTVPADQPIDLHGAMEEQSLDVFALFWDAVAGNRTAGRLTARLDVTGTITNPVLSGTMKVRDGTVGIKDIETNFTNLQADLRFDKDFVVVERLTGASSAKGTFEVVPGGTISLRNVIGPATGQPVGVMDLTVRAQDMSVAEQDLFHYQERVSGTFSTAGGGLKLSGPLMEPAIAGKVSVASMTAMLSPAPKVEPRPLGFNPTFDLDFELAHDFWFRNPNLVALMQGSVHLGGRLTGPEVTPDLTIRSGRIRLAPQYMRITKGTIRVPLTGRDAGRLVVDVTAQTPVTATSLTGTRRRYTIVLSVRGPLGDLGPENIDVVSEPPGLSRQEILAALGHVEDIFGGGEPALRQQLSEVFTLAVSPVVFGPLETAFIEALRLEEFNIEYGIEQPLAVFASKKLFDGIYLSYWQIVSGVQTITGTTYSLKISYRVRDWLDIGWGTDSRRIRVLEATYGHRF
jgi:translocation and assembly module TamB